ncbi:uncharacterized protein SAPINGB_P002646 [Magnusiomyces paraingens]|uniref:Uncharacterized protein n=1 Tax=Magnusiomyces paraingens TaxID=2606893 RepID=A0A5E8BH60_9ASCO|nr:uncharacterized protein SAPINGB_P002646 [Saprochaete ingens]VVT50191.1 unnamed protein product [Saprochaete ingens]
MLGQKSIRTSIWATKNSGRLYYAQLLQQVKASDTPRYFSYTPTSLQAEKEEEQQQQQQQQQQSWPQPSEPVISVTQESLSTTRSSSKPKMLSTSGIFSDLFTSIVEDPKPVEVGIPLYDSSIQDVSKNPSSEELRERIKLSLAQNPENIFKFLSSSYLSNFDILENRWNISRESFENDNKVFRAADHLTSENLSMIELVEINKVIIWQFKRWVLLKRINNMMKEAQEDSKDTPANDTKNPKRPRLSKYKYLDFSILDFLGLRERDPVQRLRVSGHILLNEARYIRELTRLYQLTGIRELRDHVLSTAPLINRVCHRLQASYNDRTDKNLVAPENCLSSHKIADASSRSTFMFMANSARPFLEITDSEGHQLNIPEAYLSPYRFVPIYWRLLHNFNDIEAVARTLKSPPEADQIDF